MVKHASSYFIFTALRLCIVFSLSCGTSFIEPKLLGLQVVIINHECTENECENYISKGSGFALSHQNNYTAVTLAFNHNHCDNFHILICGCEFFEIFTSKDRHDLQF